VPSIIVILLVFCCPCLRDKRKHRWWTTKQYSSRIIQRYGPAAHNAQCQNSRTIGPKPHITNRKHSRQEII